MTSTDALIALEPEQLSAPNSKFQSDDNKWPSVAKAVFWRLFTMVVSIALILVVWQLFLEVFNIDSFIGRGPVDVWNYLSTGQIGADARDQLWTASVDTMVDAGLGLFAGAAAAVLCALAFNLAPSAEQTFMPMAIVLRSVPLVAMTPLIALIFGRDHVLARLGWFFSKLAVVTFGGAYAVLAYMAQDVVSAYGWLTAGQMMDGLGLAETTPGPLILVTEFVGFLAAHQAGGASPYVMGVLGAIVAVWATFAPCFLWIFTGAPYVERLQAEPRLKAALAGVMAAVVGVIMNLTVWFALNVLFGRVGETAIGPARLYIPELATVSWPAVLLSALAFVLMFGLHRGMITTLGVCAGLALGWHYIG